MSLDMPSGAVTILFTDIEGSTRLWERDRARMSRALAAHDALARDAVERVRGRPEDDGARGVDRPLRRRGDEHSREPTVRLRQIQERVMVRSRLAVPVDRVEDPRGEKE